MNFDWLDSELSRKGAVACLQCVLMSPLRIAMPHRARARSTPNVFICSNAWGGLGSMAEMSDFGGEAMCHRDSVESSASFPHRGAVSRGGVCAKTSE